MILRRHHGGFLVQLGHHVAGVKLLHFHHQRLFVMTGQEKQALDQFLHAGGFLGDGVDALLQHGLVVLAPALEHADIPLYHGDGGSQLVGCVGYKLLLAVVAALDAVKHGVNDGGQILQLVLCPLDVDAVGQVAGGQGSGHVGNVADGRQHALVQAVSLADKVQHAQ